MFQSERMKKVSVLALERDVDRLMMGLGRLRAIHLTPPSKSSEGTLLGPSDRDEEIARLVSLEHRIERAAGILQVSLDRTMPEVPEQFAGPDEVAGTLDRIEPEIDRLIAQQQVLGDEAAHLRTMISRVETFEGTALAPSRIDEFSFVHFALGAIDEDRLKRAASEVEPRVLLVPFRDAGNRQKVLAITSKKGRFALDSTLQKLGFQPEEATEDMPGLPDEVLARARKRLAEVLEEDTALGRELAKIGEAEAPELRRFWRQIRVRQKILRAHENLGRTRSTYLVSGWVPEEMVETFASQVLELTEHRAVIEIFNPEDLPDCEEPPTAFKHSVLVRPFGLLVSGYGYPRYREIEPTLLVAISYFLMFGAMFGDVGQGLVLVLLGLAVRRWASTGSGKSDTIRDFGLLISYCGISGVLFGFLYGSVFGKEGLIAPLWGFPMKNVVTLLWISVGVGVAIITTGVVLNIVNKLRSGHWAAAVFDRFGIIGIAFYWGALGLGVRYVVTGSVSTGMAVLVLSVPLALIFLREPVQFVLAGVGRRRRKGETHKADAGSREAAHDAGHERGLTGFLVAVVEGFVEVLEALLVYTANTASFMRLAAY
ncbi:MAG TPA: V-type ATPase 116kDa subunit family protein, partial [Planctomycetota bacterium]|nr:V-type ATPase 116kDa subunit family protein [Planctomycetota bacterium]